MKKFSLIAVIFSILGISFFALPSYIFAATVAFSFTRTLSAGMTGNDIKELQKILNSDPMTEVANTGPGSSGQESTYFGALTKDAVVRFQVKYGSQILAPNGLTAGTGIVGISTRAILNGLELTTEPPASVAPVTPKPVVQTSSNTSILPNSGVNTAQPRASSSTTTSVNPNLQNLDKFISAIDTVSKKQGISATSIAQVEDQVRKDVMSTTTDLEQAFVNIVQKKAAAAASSGSPFDKILGRLSLLLADSFSPKKASAESGSPFGGALLFSFFCSCSGNWLITVEPLPPTFVALLTYEIGSQAYLTYNIPYTTWLFGEYTGGAQCQIVIGTGCATIASEGAISPTVGSSPI